MKKNGLFKCICLILSLLLLFSGAFTALAADDEPGAEPPTEEKTAEDTVARLYICSRKNTWIGHIFLYLENLSDETLTVGVYDLPPDEGVSIGTYGFTRSDGFGVYFNIEAYIYNAYGDQDIICLSSDLTEAELERFSHRLLYCNTWDILFFNCAFFGFMMWNTVASPFLVPLLFPMLGRLQIKAHGGQAAPKFFFPEKERVYKLRGAGGNCYLETVKEKSIAK